MFSYIMMAVPLGARWTLYLLTFMVWTCFSTAKLESTFISMNSEGASFREFIRYNQNSLRVKLNLDVFVMNENLNNDAQAWAEKVAMDCKASYSKPSERDKSMGGYTDEYVVQSDPTNQKMERMFWDTVMNSLPPTLIGHTDKARDAYPYPVYNGAPQGPLFEKFRLFTQTVWKNTQYVGYGYAVNPACQPGSMEYIVIRYFPGGNLEGQFKDNVLPMNGGPGQLTIDANAYFDEPTDTNPPAKDDFRVYLLSSYNKLRETHQVDALVLNERLNDDAQSWAQKMADNCKASEDKPSARDKSLGGPTAEYAVQSDPKKQKRHNRPWDTDPQSLPNRLFWILKEQVESYPFPVYSGTEKDPQFEKFRVFSQAVWKNTQSVGFGYAFNANCKPGSKEYLVARFFPGGNLVGQFKKNVFPMQTKQNTNSGGAGQKTIGADEQYRKPDKTSDSSKKTIGADEQYRKPDKTSDSNKKTIGADEQYRKVEKTSDSNKGQKPDSDQKEMSESAKKEVSDWVNLGVKMFNETMTTICRYFDQQIFPYAKQNRSGRPRPSQCMFPVNDIPDIAHISDRDLGAYIKRWAKHVIPEYLPKCGHLLEDPRAAPTADESMALNDTGKDYPFRGYWNCIIDGVRKEDGDEAIKGIMSDRTHGKKDFVHTMLERQNKFRILHGSEPYQLNETLVEIAKVWAERMATDCKWYWKPKEPKPWYEWADGEEEDQEDPWVKHKDVIRSSGVTLCSGHSDLDLPLSGLQCANEWYMEIEQYPFPQGLDGPHEMPDSRNVSQFTQTVWRGSKHVGYGVAVNRTCNEKKRSITYIIALYYFGGNWATYNWNVYPPKGSAVEKAFFKNRDDNQRLVQVGADMYDETYYKVCWYVKMKVETIQREYSFRRCHSTAQSFLYENQDGLAPFWKCKMHFNYEGQYWLTKYHEKCENLVDTPKAAPVNDESEVLNDRGKEYAYKAYMHCLIHTLREKHGDKAIEEIKHKKAVFVLKEEYVPEKYKKKSK